MAVTVVASAFDVDDDRWSTEVVAVVVDDDDAGWTTIVAVAPNC